MSRSARGRSSTSTGVILGRGDATREIVTTVRHAEPHGVSRQVIRSVLHDRATGSFLGKVAVARGAQKTDAVQSGHGAAPVADRHRQRQTRARNLCRRRQVRPRRDGRRTQPRRAVLHGEPRHRRARGEGAVDRGVHRRRARGRARPRRAALSRGCAHERAGLQPAARPPCRLPRARRQLGVPRLRRDGAEAGGSDRRHRAGLRTGIRHRPPRRVCPGRRQ